MHVLSQVMICCSRLATFYIALRLSSSKTHRKHRSTKYRNLDTSERKAVVSPDRWRRAAEHTYGTSISCSMLSSSRTSSGNTRCTQCHWHRVREGSQPDRAVTGSRRRGCTSEVVQCRRSRLVERPSQSGVRHF